MKHTLGEDTIEPEQDYNSIANIQKVAIISYDFDLTLDLAAWNNQGQIGGTVTLNCIALEDNVKDLQLDAWGLVVNKVTVDIDSMEVMQMDIPDTKWVDEQQVDIQQGGYIRVTLNGLNPNLPSEQGLSKDDEFSIKFTYFTSENAVGKPTGYTNYIGDDAEGNPIKFFYIQNQPIYARTWYPCFDTPQSWSIYNMRLQVPTELPTVFATHNEKIESAPGDEGYTAFTFKQTRPIAAYQFGFIATTVEESKNSGDTDKVQIFAGADEIDAAYTQMSRAAEYLTNMEKVANMPFLWPQLYIIVMPPSYPLGGEVHGNVMYVSPTLLNSGKTGHASIMHYLANLYFGQIVTCSSWSPYWLNEGLATFFERHVVNKYEGTAYGDVDSVEGNFELYESIKMIEQDALDNSFTTLSPELITKNPIDNFTAVPYEKGYQFMVYIQDIIGGSEVAQEMLQLYLQLFSFNDDVPGKKNGVDNEMFQLFVIDFIQDTGLVSDPDEAIAKIDFDVWLNGQGMPAEGLVTFNSVEYDYAQRLANKFIQFNGSSTPRNWQDFNNFPSPDMKYLFVDEFIRKAYMTTPRLIKQLDELYTIHEKSEDLKLLSKWFQLCSLHDYLTADVSTALKDYVAKVGRNDFVVPIYNALIAAGETEYAKTQLKKNKHFYHYQTYQPIRLALDPYWTEIDDYI